jgi:hypothetical protein
VSSQKKNQEDLFNLLDMSPPKDRTNLHMDNPELEESFRQRKDRSVPQTLLTKNNMAVKPLIKSKISEKQTASTNSSKHLSQQNSPAPHVNTSKLNSEVPMNHLQFRNI